MINVWPVSVEQGNLRTRLSLMMRMLGNSGADKKEQRKEAAYSRPAQWLEKSPICRRILNCGNKFLQHSEVSASAVTRSPKGIETGHICAPSGLNLSGISFCCCCLRNEEAFCDRTH